MERVLRKKTMLSFFVLAGAWAWPVFAGAAPQMKILEPYVNLRSAPGAFLPVFDIVRKGEQVEVLRERTDWFELRTAEHVTGWAYRSEIKQSLDASELIHHDISKKHDAF